LQDLRPHQIPAYRFWAGYFRNGIAEAGYELAEIPNVDWAEGITNLSAPELAKWRDITWSRTVQYLDRETKEGRAVDLFLSYLYPVQVDIGAIAEIQRLGIPCVNFFCDNVREFTNVPPVFSCFDLHWVPEFEALPMYHRAGLKTCFAAMPCWVSPEARASATTETEQVTFIGSADDLRSALFSKALSLGASIKIGGKGWLEESDGDNLSSKPGRSILEMARNQARFVRDRGVAQWLRKLSQRIPLEAKKKVPAAAIMPPINKSDYVKLTRESMITIGVNRVPTFRRPPSDPLTYSRLRDIEAPMMGACYLTEWTEGLGQFYQIGTEIETYRTAAELVTKIELLRSDPTRRRNLRRNGQEKALAELTIAKSLTKIISALRS
jgi:hypothetical protein